MKNKIVLLVCLIGLVFSGCISIQAPIVSDKSFPSDGRYEIVGRVIYFAKKITVLGIFSNGGATYAELYRKARRLNNKTDDVVSVSVDVDIFSFCGIYTVHEYTLWGVAIRYTDGATAVPKSAGTPAVE